jgi:L1 cell adhesion molecule like protein
MYNGSGNSNTSIGIDLGTTNSCVGIYKNDDVIIIPNEQGCRTTPSYVSFNNGEILIGQEAKNLADMNPKNTIFDAKRLLGRKYSDTAVQNDIKHLPYTVKEGENEEPVICININNEERKFTPTEISAMIVGKMKQIAEDYLGSSVREAVITVPAYFNDAQRTETKKAGELAGLKVLRIINEPTAASLSYGLDSCEEPGEENILVFDLGGGTFDVSLLTIDQGLFEVKATSGNTRLGGEDFDNKLITWCLKEFKRKNKDVDVGSLIRDSKVKRKLRTSCENAKKVLSVSTNGLANIEVDSLYDGIDFVTQISRAKFEDLCRDSFNKCFKPIEQVLKDSGLSKDEVDEVVLIGGSTRIPKIRDDLKKYFNKDPRIDINPDEAVAFGAAVQAVKLGTNNNDNNNKINSIILVDVSPLSLGIETSGGIMTRLIKRNTTIPCTKERIFSTHSDNQPSITIKVYEGERELVKYNNLLDVFELVGIPPMHRGTPKIHVKFTLDANCILNIKATEESSGISKGITIHNDKNRFTDDELNQMVGDAEEHEQEDTIIKENIKARAKLETYLYNIRNTIDDETVKYHLTEDQFKKVNDIIKDSIQWLDNNDLLKDDYNNKQLELEKEIRPIILSIYGDKKIEKQ